MVRSASISSAGTSSRLRYPGAANEMCIASCFASSAEPRILTRTPILFAGGWTYAALVLELVSGPGPVPVHGLEHLLGEGEELVVLGHRLRLAADSNERSAVFVHA